MMTGRVGEYKREDKDDALRPGVRVSIAKKEFKPKKAIRFLSITVASGLLMVSVYNSLVDTKSWGFDIPSVYSAVRDDDFFGGPILLSWQKLKVYSEEWCRTLNPETGNE